MKKGGTNICLQDTNLLENESNLTKIFLKCDCHLSGFCTNSRGVTIVLCSNFEYKTIKVEIDKNDNYIYLDIELQSFSLRLINIYAPKNDMLSFFDHLQKMAQENEQNYVAICGDFNLVLVF